MPVKLVFRGRDGVVGVSAAEEVKVYLEQKYIRVEQ